jgi:hypothetical protein
MCALGRRALADRLLDIHTFHLYKICTEPLMKRYRQALIIVSFQYMNTCCLNMTCTELKEHTFKLQAGTNEYWPPV